MTQPRSALDGRSHALVVDVDGTLLRTDLLWEGIVRLTFSQPWKAFLLFGLLLRGKAWMKCWVAKTANLDLTAMPFEEPVRQCIEAAKALGVPVILASAADLEQVRELGRVCGISKVLATQGSTNLRGTAKLSVILQSSEVFDYIGDSHADLPIWQKARTAIAVNPSRSTFRRAQRMRPDLKTIRTRPPVWRTLPRAMRPHQWAKNTLLFLPAIAAHLRWEASAFLTLILGFVAFSFVASAVYLMNDLADLPHDRRHPTKKNRPLAAGDLTIPAAVAAATMLLIISAIVSFSLPGTFRLVLATYFGLTVAYSLILKRRIVVDVIALATLYTIRVVAGATLLSVPLSRWFLAFSVFFFFSLALVKRVIELKATEAASEERVAGRGYRAEDLPILLSLGAAAISASSLVYCLYITGNEVNQLYENPDMLWLGLPIFLYWQARIWLLANRQAVDDDPVSFALKDRMSYLSGLSFLLIVWLAT